MPKRHFQLLGVGPDLLRAAVRPVREQRRVGKRFFIQDKRGMTEKVLFVVKSL